MACVGPLDAALWREARDDIGTARGRSSNDGDEGAAAVGETGDEAGASLVAVREKARGRRRKEKVELDRGSAGDDDDAVDDRGRGEAGAGRAGTEADVESGRGCAKPDERLRSALNEGDLGTGGVLPSSAVILEALLDGRRKSPLLLDLTDLADGAGLGARLPLSGSADVERESRFDSVCPRPLLRLALTSPCVRPVTGGYDLPPAPDTLRRMRDDRGGGPDGAAGPCGTPCASSDARGDGGNGTTPSHSVSSMSTTCPRSPAARCFFAGFVTLRCRGARSASESSANGGAGGGGRWYERARWSTV